MKNLLVGAVDDLSLAVFKKYDRVEVREVFTDEDEIRLSDRGAWLILEPVQARALAAALIATAQSVEEDLALDGVAV